MNKNIIDSKNVTSITEARIYIINRFNNMTDEEYDSLCYGDGLLTVADEAMEQFNVSFEDIEQTYYCYSAPRFNLFGYRVSVNQIIDDASCLYCTINEFSKPVPKHFNNRVEYDEHLIGKFKFFLDLIIDCLGNTSDIVNNYISMFEYIKYTHICNDDDVSDLKNDYEEFFIERIDGLIEVFEKDGWVDDDEVLAHLTNLDDMNMQEIYLLRTCYLSICASYKLSRCVNDEIVDEEVYYNCLEQAAITSYCKEYGCKKEDVIVQMII